jgi:hypothetical protein
LEYEQNGKRKQQATSFGDSGFDAARLAAPPEA